MRAFNKLCIFFNYWMDEKQSYMVIASKGYAKEVIQV